MDQWIYFHRTLSEGQENYRRSKIVLKIMIGNLRFYALNTQRGVTDWIFRLFCLSVDESRDTVKNLFFISYCHDMREKMGNKNNHKHRRPAGTDKKTTSKGNIYFNPHQILIADWLRLHTGGFPLNIKDSECMCM